MKNSKLYQTITNLTDKELARFQSFVDSPYFNRKNEICKLVSILISSYLYKNEVEKEKVHQMIFPGDSYDDTTMRLLVSDAYQLLDRFMAIEKIKKDGILEKIYTIKAYRSRMFRKPFEMKLSNLRRKLEKIQLKDSDFLWKQYLIESEKHLYLENSKIRGQEPNYQVAMNTLDEVYLANKLKYMCKMLNYKNVTSTAYNISLQYQIVELVENSDFYNSPAIKIYYHIFKTLNEFNDDSLYTNALSEIKLNLKFFTKDESRELFLYCMNYCIKKINTGNSIYEVRMLDIIKEMINSNLILENGHMSPWLYKNITSIGLRTGETEWTIQFLKQYRYQIDPEFIDNAYIYNLAKVYFNKGKFNKVIETLREVEYSDLFYALDVRAMLLKTYFELREFVAMNSLATSFRQFVRRQTKLSETHKQNYLNLISFTKKFANAFYEDNMNASRLKDQLTETKYISDRKWLMKKLYDIGYMADQES